MSKAELTTVAGIKAEIASIAKAGKTLDGRIQRCAVAAFEHMLTPIVTGKQIGRAHV